MSEPHSPSANSTHTRPLKQPRYPSGRLSLTERAALSLMGRLNRPGWLQKVGLLWGRHVSQRLVQAIYLRRLRTFYDERLEGLPSDASVLIVANHRTFYDLFVIATALRVRSAHRLGVPSVFPVRSPFFYDNPLGVFLCLFFSGGCMYPPVFRDERKHELNPVGVEVMRWLLTQPKVCLGIHPEGHRSKQPDHYTLEPPKRGVGVLLSDPPPNLYLLPVFVEGLNNSFGVELKRAFKGRSAEPVKVWWGEPVHAQTLSGEPEALASHAHALIQTLADHAKEMSS